MMVVLASVYGAQAAQAHIVRIEVTSKQSPALDGKSFGTVGQYEEIRGRMYGEVDPKLPGNKLITDIELAPRNARGMVEYSMDFYLLKPLDLRKGNHRLVLDVPNRGSKLITSLSGISDGLDPVKLVDKSFLLERGYTVIAGGWDISATSGNDHVTFRAPIARNADGSSITGPSYEFISQLVDKAEYQLTYPTASLDKSKATLTVRDRLTDAPQILSADKWEYAGENTIHLLPAGTPFRQGTIYEFRYEAKDPLVAGLGLAAIRDLVSFLRYAKAGDPGPANPLAGEVKYTLGFMVSQSARFMNDFQLFGFNRDVEGRQVMDGIVSWVGSGDGGNINYRFAQPNRTERNRENHLYPESTFPFAYPVLTDKLTGRTAGRNESCTATHTCMKVMAANSSNEYWVKAGSLLHSDLSGKDLPDPDNVRFFLVAGMQHSTGSSIQGACQQLQNPTYAETMLRALFLSLDEWVANGTAPPASRVPRVSEGTAVFATVTPGSPTGVVPQAALGWPTIPGVTYNGVITTRYALDWGRLFFDKGIISNLPTQFDPKRAYPIFVSKVDADGNEVAGVRLPAVAAPIATLTGWGLRRAGFGENDGCDGLGQNIPFKTTKAERVAAGDPRLSLEERYKTHAGYVEAVTKAVKELEAERLLLPEDGQRYIDRAQVSNVLR